MSAMPSQQLEYVIKLIEQGDTANSVRKLRDLNDQAGKTKDGLDKLARQAESALAIIGSVVAINSAIESAVEYEKVMARLNGTLKATGQFSQEYADELAAQRKELSATTEAGGKQLASIQALLISFGATRQQLPELTKAVLDLSAGMGIDANAAAMELAKAMEGIEGPLKRIGISFDANATKSENVASAITQINSKFKDLATALEKTPAGTFEQMEKAAGGLKKEFGELALQGLQPVFQYTTDSSRALAEFLKHNETAADLVKQLVLIASTLGTITAGTKAFGMAWNFIVGDAIKQAGGLSTALNSIPKTIQVSIIAAATVEIAKLVKEAVGEIMDEANQQKSAGDLAAQNDSRRIALESLINAAAKAGTISDEKALADLAALNKAFTPKINYALSGRGAAYGGPYQEVTERDPASEAKILASLYKQYTGYGSSAPSVPSGSSAASAALLNDQKKAREELAALDAKAEQEKLDGFDKERQAAADVYNANVKQITDIAHKNELTDDERNQHIASQQEAYAAKLDQINAAQNQHESQRAEQLAELKARLQTGALTGIEKEIAIEGQRYQLAAQHIQNQIDLTDEEKKVLQELNAQQHAAALGNLANSEQVKAGANVAGQLQAYAAGGQKALNDFNLNQQFDERKKALEEYYAYAQSMAQDDAESWYALESQKTADLKTLLQERAKATSESYQLLKDVGTYAATQFSSGLASAMVEFASNTKSAGQAFGDFAKQFLAQIAQMILQLLILKALQSAFGFGLAGGGMVPANKAATGAMLAATGIQGVSELNGPTYFPRFNVLAGEAGREVMTVLAKPQAMSVGGFPVMTGNVGPDRLALLSMSSLNAMVANSNRFASGGVAGAMPSVAPVGGTVTIAIRMDPSLRAEIIQSSVAGARVQIATDLATDTPVRSAAKAAVS